MILNVLVFLLIVMITMYLATQGMVSAMIALVTATFSSILAMALTEPLSGLIASFRPDAARGCTFLLLFLLIFSGTRIIGDMVVKKNIKLNVWINRGMGAFFGFFTALVVIGSVVIGLELLPVQRTLLGFDRFPAPKVMTALDSDDKPAYGEVTSRRSGVWFAPDGFVLGIWNLTSGKSLGGSTEWKAVHPDFSAETYGQRYPVFAGSVRTIPSDMLKVVDVWTSTEPKDYQGRGIPAQPGKRVVLVRAEIQKGTAAPHVTFDADGYLRVSAAQVRLVTDKNHQYFPIGDMIQGLTFEPLALDGGFVVDDYNSKGVATEDWVFAIPETDNPSLFEIKTARATDLAANAKDKPFAPLRVADYPARAYYKDLCSVTVTFDPVNSKVVAGHVYVLKPDAQMRDIFPLMKPAYQNVLQTLKDVDAGANGWTNPPKPGLPSYGAIRGAQRIGVNRTNDPDDLNVNWSEVLQVVLMGQITPDPRQNLVAVPRFLKEDVVRSWNSVRSGSIISGEAEANNSEGGVWKASVNRIAPAPHPVVITLETETSFFVWIKNPEFNPPPDAKQPKRDFAYTVTADSAGGSDMLFHIDLNEKPQ